MQLIQIGHDGPKVAPIGMGTWAWGDTLFWSYGRDYGEEDLRAAYDASLEAGVTFFDTAEVYGSGRSEQLLGRFAAGNPDEHVVASKFFPYPWRVLRSSLQKRRWRAACGVWGSPACRCIRSTGPFHRAVLPPGCKPWPMRSKRV